MSGTAVYACEYSDCSIHHDNILFVFDIRGGTAVHACEHPLHVQHSHKMFIAEIRGGTAVPCL